jgi:hypothetical protein
MAAVKCSVLVWRISAEPSAKSAKKDITTFLNAHVRFAQYAFI